MKKIFLFIVKLILAMVLTIGAYQLTFWYLWDAQAGPDAYENAYQKALLLQYHALESEERSPEVIVFGSSYVPFGIDTKVMEEELGRPVQILGVEASIGIPFLVDVLYDTAKPGDTIVYMLGKSNWYNEDFMVISAALESDKTLLHQYWDSRDDTLLGYQNKMIWRKLYTLTCGRMIESIRSDISKKEQVYELSSFDENGNMIVNRQGTLISTDVSPSDTLNFSDMEVETLDMLNEFYDWCEDNDITFVIAYSMYIDGSLVETEESLAVYHEQMTDYMNADILLTPQDYFLPVDDFYNHSCHLNSEGARAYSAILGEALNQYLDEKSDTE